MPYTLAFAWGLLQIRQSILEICDHTVKIESSQECQPKGSNRLFVDPWENSREFLRKLVLLVLCFVRRFVSCLVQNIDHGAHNEQ